MITCFPGERNAFRKGNLRITIGMVIELGVVYGKHYSDIMQFRYKDKYLNNK